jgi:hypothetical protein
MTSALLYQWVPRRGLLLSFLSVGLGFWTKFNSALVFPILALAGWWRREWRKPALACCGAILGLPWMVRNFFMVGDPVYPMLYKILGDDTGALTDLLYQEAYGIWELGRWAVARELFGSVVVREGFPLAILLVLVALWKGRKQRNTWALLSMSGILFVAALVQRRYELRLVQFLLVPLCVLACLAWEHFRTTVRQGGAVVLAAWVMLSTFSGGRYPSVGLKWAYWTDLSSSYEEKIDAILSPASEVWRCVNRLPEQAVVLVPDSRLYYLQRRAFSLRNPLLHDLYSAGSLEQRMRVLSGVGITHVAIYSPSVAHESLLVSACRLQDVVQWPGTRLVCLTKGGGVWELGPVP